MPAECHIARVALYAEMGPGVTTPTAPPASTTSTVECCEYCEYCDAAQLTWRKCKQVCLACGQINRSCADL